MEQNISVPATTEATRLSLYGLTQGMDELMTKVAEAGGELTPELEALHAELDALLLNKVDSCAGWRQSQLDLVKAIEGRIQDFEALQDRVQYRIQRFEEYVRGVVERREDQKLVGKTTVVSIRKAPESVEVFVRARSPRSSSTPPSQSPFP